MPNIGWTELIIVIFLVLLLFGANKLPDLARSMGRSARIFKSEVKEMRKEDEAEAPTQQRQIDARRRRRPAALPRRRTSGSVRRIIRAKSA